MSVSLNQSLLIFLINMGKDKTTPKSSKTPSKPEQRADESFTEMSNTGTAPALPRTAEDFQEAFAEIKLRCATWSAKQSELWKLEMTQQKEMIIESINKAIDEKMQPKIDRIGQFSINLEAELKQHKLEIQKANQTIASVKDLQKNMSRVIEATDKRFAHLNQVSKQLQEKLEISDQHLTCYRSRMDILHESLDEHEKRWMSWESGDTRMTPCYRDVEHKKKHERTVIDETEDESPNEPSERIYGGGPQPDHTTKEAEEDVGTAEIRQEHASGPGHTSQQRYKLNTGGVKPKAFGGGNRQSFKLPDSLFDYVEQNEDRQNPSAVGNQRTASPVRPETQTSNPSGIGGMPNSQFSRPPPLTAQQSLLLDKQNLMEEIKELYDKFDRTPIETEKKKLKHLFFDRYEEVSKVLEELRITSGDPNQRSQIRRDRDRVNAFKTAFGPLEIQRKQRHRIDPPEFDGDILKYHGWRNQWETYDSDNMYTVEEKFQMLTGCLKDEAAEATSAIAFSPSNYKLILDILKDRFGSDSQAIDQRKHLLRQAATEEVSVDYSSEQLTIKHNKIQNQILSLRSLGIHVSTYDEQITNMLMASLPEAITTSWQREWGYNIQPSLDQALTALHKEIRMKQSDELRRASSRTSRDLSVNATQSRFVRSRTPTPSPKECLFCDSKMHPSFKCTEDTIEARKATLAQQKRCFRCLREGHRVAECTSNIQCHLCNSKDHQLVICDIKASFDKYHSDQKGNPSRGRPTNRANRSRERSKSGSKTRHPSADKITKNVVINTAATEIQTNMNICTVPDTTNPGMTPMMIGKLKLKTGGWKRVKILLDTGSSSTFIRKQLLEVVDHDYAGKETISMSTFADQKKVTQELDIAYVNLTSIDGGVSIKYRVISKPFIQKVYPMVNTDVESQLRKDKKTLAYDNKQKHRVGEEIDMLIGSDSLASTLSHSNMRFGKDASVAWDTHFGWVIMGGKQKPEYPIFVGTVIVEQDKSPSIKQLDKDFKAFWELEHLGILPSEQTKDQFLDSYLASITRDDDNRYVVKYPFRNDITDYDDCLAIATKRLNSLLASQKFSAEHRAEYHKIFEEYLVLGFIEEADPYYLGKTAYLPHRPVIRETAETTKIRPVFDGSVHFKHRRSFNANLEVGPNLNPDIMGILMRWRRHKVAWTADIEKAFLQIAIHPEHKQIVRFLWVEDITANKPTIKHFIWKRLPFGLTSSPFILRAVMLKHFKQYEAEFPGITNEILDQLYVDDWMGGAEDPRAAKVQVLRTQRILSEARFTLSKWITNSEELIQDSIEEIPFSQNISTLACEKSFDHKPNKALGIIWYPKDDAFQFSPDAIRQEANAKGDNITKRQLFSLALKIYDPLGLISLNFISSI